MPKKIHCTQKWRASVTFITPFGPKWTEMKVFLLFLLHCYCPRCCQQIKLQDSYETYGQVLVISLHTSRHSRKEEVKTSILDIYSLTYFCKTRLTGFWKNLWYLLNEIMEHFISPHADSHQRKEEAVILDGCGQSWKVISKFVQNLLLLI